MQNILNLPITKAKQNITTQVFWITVFTTLTAVGAWLEIPTKPVPFTLQTFFVLLSGAMLGARNGFLSQVVYLTVGAIGLPVFAGLSMGWVKLMGPTGGYLLSFPLAAFAVGYLIQLNNKYIWSIVSMAIGMLIIFSFGTLFLNFVYFHDWTKSFVSGFLIFSWWDVVKVIAAGSIYRGIQKYNFKK